LNKKEFIFEKGVLKLYVPIESVVPESGGFVLDAKGE
jgi:hypothetical protein